MRKPALFLLFSLLAGAASAQRTDISLFCGLAWPSHEVSAGGGSVDQYGTVVSHGIDDEADPSRMYGISARFLGSAGFGFEVSYERASIDVDGESRTDVLWNSVLGPQSETLSGSADGTLDVEPLAVNAVYRAAFGDRVGLAISAGAAWERLRWRRNGTVGLVTYFGDSIEAYEADFRERSEDDRFTWDAGLALDVEVGAGWTVFADGRFYADAGREIEERDVRAGSYTGVFLGETVVLDEAGAAAATASLGDAPEIDTQLVRAAVGIRYRF
jgi:hypothetical protein